MLVKNDVKWVLKYQVSRYDEHGSPWSEVEHTRVYVGSIFEVAEFYSKLDDAEVFGEFSQGCFLIVQKTNEIIFAKDCYELLNLLVFDENEGSTIYNYSYDIIPVPEILKRVAA